MVELTFSPFCICFNKFIHKRHIFESLSLRLSDHFRIAAFVGPKQVQVEHHDCTLVRLLKRETRAETEEPVRNVVVLASQSKWVLF